MRRGTTTSRRGMRNHHNHGLLNSSYEPDGGPSRLLPNPTHTFSWQGRLVDGSCLSRPPLEINGRCDPENWVPGLFVEGNLAFQRLASPHQKRQGQQQGGADKESCASTSLWRAEMANKPIVPPVAASARSQPRPITGVEHWFSSSPRPGQELDRTNGSPSSSS